MSPMKRGHISEAVEKRFVGRQEALDIFYQRFAYRHMKNAVYYHAPGGVGKTWILQKIFLDNQHDPTRTVTDIVDFFDTRNQSIYGLQATIRSRLEFPKAPDAFQPYDAVMEQLETARADEQAKHTGLLASLESRANKIFLKCCEKALVGREVILLFDTFERVQQRHVGQWLLKEFLPQIRWPMVAITGRPIPAPAAVPDNVVSYELPGLKLADVQEYVHRTWPLSIPDHIVQRVWEQTNGVPLLIDLIFDLTSEQFIRNLDELDHISRIQDSERLKRELTKHFRAATELDRVIWAMAFLKRRFDMPMLGHIVEKGELLELDAAGHEQIMAQLRRFKFVKEYPELESHLLHDAMQEIVEEYLLEGVDPQRQIRDSLYDLIVLHYYPEVRIDQAIKNNDLALARQLQAEQLGYILDRDVKTGLERHDTYQNEIDNTHEHDFEELLWGEVRDHLDRLEGGGYEVAYQRGQWLRKHSLFAKAEEHFREMLTRYTDRQVEISKSLGFALLRQGKVQDAIDIFDNGRKLVAEENVDELADFENLLGQANRFAGRWDKALDHYTLSARASILARNSSGISGALVNRGYLYSLQGQYSAAILDCERALEYLSSLPAGDQLAQRRRIYAQMNLGTAHRHSGNYETAATWYQATMALAQDVGDQEALCNVLQQLGINACLQGRKLRQDGKELAQATRLQAQAWHHLAQALEIARAANWRSALADGLSRMARVYEETSHLASSRDSAAHSTPEFSVVLSELQAKAGTFQPPTEVEYEYELLSPKHFSELDWMEKSARLFELSALTADEANDFHRALDSLMEFARLLLELKRYDAVPIVVRRSERIKGFDYQEDLFSAMSDITLADLDFELGKPALALEKYANAYAAVAKQSGYATYLLTDRLRSLRERLHGLAREMKLQWCDILEERWLEQSVSTVRPDMLQMLEEIRFEAVK